MVCRMMKARKLLIYSTTLFLTCNLVVNFFCYLYAKLADSVFLFPLILILAALAFIDA